MASMMSATHSEHGAAEHTPAEHTAVEHAPAENATADNTPAEHPVDELSAKLRPAIMRVSRRLRAEKADHELSDSQSAIMGYLHNHGPSTPGVLAAFERVTPPSMNRTLNALVGAAYVTRTPSADDGRKVVVSLTTEGTALVRETRRQREAWLYQRLAELPPDARQTLDRAADILRALADS